MERPHKELPATEMHRLKVIRHESKAFWKRFHHNLAVNDLVDVYVKKLKGYRLGKIIERNKKGYFVMLDGHGISPDSDNVTSPFDAY